MVLSAYSASKSAEQLSASSVTSPVRVKSAIFTSHSIVISAGTVNVGAVESSTVTICSPVAEFPQESVAVHTLLIVFVLPHSVSTISS